MGTAYRPCHKLATSRKIVRQRQFDASLQPEARPVTRALACRGEPYTDRLFIVRDNATHDVIWLSVTELGKYILSEMASRVYLETTVLSYLVARPSRDVAVNAHQIVTKLWWERARERFDLVVSAVTIDEAGAGDPDVARRRLALITGLPAVPVTLDVRNLARSLIDGGVLPAKALADALHLAAAAVNKVEYLVTWNLRHLAGAVTRRRLENALRDRGYEPPTICTPEELLSEPEDS